MPLKTERFDLGTDYEVECRVSVSCCVGDICHIRRNRIGSGARLTPVARFFV